MTKILAAFAFFFGLAVAVAIYGSVIAQTSTVSPSTTPATSVTSTPRPSEVVPSAAPATGRG